MNLDSLISKNLREKYEKERLEHTPSGKLSAGQLGKPLLEQILKLIGVPEKPIDDYTLRLFERGKQVEEWVTSMIPGDEQVEVSYRDVIGYVDKLTDVPIEIKSVKSSQWKWLKEPKLSHKLQAGLYALGTNSPTYKVVYVTSDDFRTRTFELRTIDIKPEIDRIIDEVENQLKTHTLPLFEPREDWQGKDTYQKYTNYPEWIYLDTQLAMQKLGRDFPEAYKKLVG